MSTQNTLRSQPRFAVPIAPWLVSSLLFLGTVRAFAQHEGHTMPMPAPSPSPAAPAKPMQGMDHEQMQHGSMDGGHTIGMMKAATDLNIPMNQEGSGTAWLPSSSPMYGRMYMRGQDMLMLHGVITPRYVNVGSHRRQEDFSAPNWFMGMYTHPLSRKEQLGVRLMSSLDYLTNGNDGYPLLFQTGETYRGNRLVDRQHPHDLFSELSVTYSRLLPGRSFNNNNSISLYVAYPGEPALGPPTFMHRLIAQDFPDAPLGHHWTDSAHITFGVATLGVNFGQKIHLEGSVFTGREPDERRYDFDKARFDSQSGRISFNSDRENAFSVSYGFLKNPEVLEPGISQHRTTASWLYNHVIGDDANLATSVVWGMNDRTRHGNTSAFLAEAHYQTGRHNVFGRFETVQKEGEELGLGGGLGDRRFDVGAYTAGYVYDLTHGKGIDWGLGGAVTLNTKPAALSPFYGNGSPVSFQIMLRLRPSKMRGMSAGSRNRNMMPMQNMSGNGMGM